MSTSLVALLPKGSNGQLDDYRPIVLLSAVYRIWVGLRMRTFRGWLRANNVLALKTQGGAESLAYDFALRMTDARATGAAITGHHLARVTIEFGKALCLVPNLDKSCFFSTDLAIRRELRGGPFPVVDSF